MTGLNLRADRLSKTAGIDCRLGLQNSFEGLGPPGTRVSDVDPTIQSRNDAFSDRGDRRGLKNSRRATTSSVPEL